MKAHKAHRDGSYWMNSRKWARIGEEESVHKFYWIHAPEFLFGVRASPQGQFVYESINPAFESLLGISSEDVREKAIYDCMSGEDAKSICASCDACVAEGRPVRYQHRLALGGSQRNFETIVAPVPDPESPTIVRLVRSPPLLK